MSLIMPPFLASAHLQHPTSTSRTNALPVMPLLNGMIRIKPVYPHHAHALLISLSTQKQSKNVSAAKRMSSGIKNKRNASNAQILWSTIPKKDYVNAQNQPPTNFSTIPVRNALTGIQLIKSAWSVNQEKSLIARVLLANAH